jgi:hypothetical protein
MKSENRRVIVWAASALLLFALACSISPAVTEIPTAIPQAGGASPSPTATLPPPTSIPGATDIPSSTDTPVPDVSGGDCSYNAAFVEDITVPDNTTFSPGASFVKVWRVENTGTCPWKAGSKLVFVSGDPLGGPAHVPVGPVAPGDTADVSVSLVAPSAPGTYKGNWQMENDEGVRFGSAMYVKIVVLGPATSVPTIAPTAATPCVATDPVLEPVLDLAQSQGHVMGCAKAPAFNVAKDGSTGAFQEFWANVDNPNPHMHYRSLMIWRADTKKIYVIDGENTDASKGTLLAYTDTWEEGQPAVHPDCAGMTVPSGYQLPVRGFGKVWCTEDLVDEVGWPSQPEVQVNLLVQPMEVGWLIKVSNPLGTSYLVALGNGWAVTQFTTP